MLVYRVLAVWGVVRGGGHGGSGIEDSVFLLDKGLGPYNFIAARAGVRSRAEATEVVWALRRLLPEAVCRLASHVLRMHW